MAVSTRSARQLGSLFQNQLENRSLDSSGDHIAAARASVHLQAAKTLSTTGGELAHDQAITAAGVGKAVAATGGELQASPGGVIEATNILTADSLGFGGGQHFLTAANLSAIGEAGDPSAWNKLQMGLADIYVEAQLGLSGLSGGARDAALSSFVSSNSMARVGDGYVAIDAIASDGDGAALLAALQALGLQQGASFRNFAGGLIPIDRLDDIMGLDQLAFARPVLAETNAGTAMSQNVQAMNVDYLTATHPGVTGAGITIGVLSDSFNMRAAPITNYAQDVTSGDLPAGVNILSDFSGPSPAPTDEGRAMAQLAFDVAPGASLAFHTAFVSMADFAQGIIDLKNAGANIIVDDVRYFAEPFFQDGIIAQAVDTVYAAGAMYFSSAGNQGTSSYASNQWRGSGQLINVSGVLYELYDFDPGAGVDFVQGITKSGTITQVLNWDQPNFSVSGGLGCRTEMVLFDVTAANAFQTANTINTGGDAIDAFSNGGAFVGMAVGLRVGDAAPGRFQFVTSGGSFTFNEFNTASGTSYGHSNASSAISVAAVDWVDSGRFAAPYIAGEPMPYLENFSSRGDIPILFDTAGNRLGAGIDRSTVDFAASDGGNNTFFGSDVANTSVYTGFEADTFPNFYGTSAAAPNAAAVAALLMQAFPTATRAQIEYALKATAIDVQVDFNNVPIGDGFDNRAGYGFIQADRAYDLLAQMLTNSTTSGAGAIAIIAYNTGQSDGSGNPPTVDAMRFVALENLAAGTVIYFTDRAWNGTTFTNGANDGVATYTVPGGGLAAGATVNLTGAALGTLNPEETGDAIYAYEGSTADVPTRFLYAIEIGDGNTVFNGSLVNTGLTNGVNAIAVGLDSGSYQGPTTEAFSHLYNGESLLENISDTGNWEGDNRGGQNALDQPDHTGPYFTAPDFSIWSGATGGGDGILSVHGDSTVTTTIAGDQRTFGFNLNQLMTLDNEDLTDTLVAPRDIVFDTARGLFFIADSNISGGTNRILQGNISDLLGNPGVAPPMTVLYNDTGTTTQSQIFNLSLDSDHGIVYFTHGDNFEKVVYNTAGQTPVVLGDFAVGNPNGSTNNFIDDFVIHGSDVYLTSHRITSAADGDQVTRNYIYHISGLDFNDGAGAFSFGGGNITVLNFSPDDDDSNNGINFAAGEGFPQEEGTLEGIAISPDGNTLYFATGTTLYDHDGNAGTAPQLLYGGIFSYSLVGNPSGVYTQLYGEETAGGPKGILDDLEVDPVTGRIYFTDLTGVSGAVVNDGEGIYQLDADGTHISFFQSISNTNSLTASSLFLNRAPTVTSSTQATPTSTEVAGVNSGFSNLVQPFTALDVTDPDTAGQVNQLNAAVVRISDNFLQGATHQDRLTINGNTSGVLDFGTQDITFSYNSTTGVMTLTGPSTFNNYESAIAMVRYSVSGDNPTDYGSNLTRTIAWTVSDGLDHSDEISTTVTVTGANDAPVNTVGGTTAATEDTGIAVTGISVFDVDANPATQDIVVTLTVGHGTLSVFTNVGGGIEAADVQNDGTATVTITATQNQINTTFAANGLTYTPTGNYNGADTLTMSTNDQGFNGTGGAQTDLNDVKSITIAAVNDAPTVVNGATQAAATILEDQPSAVGQSVTSLFNTHFSDAADQQQTGPNPTGSVANTLAGIAIIANGSSGATGNWQYFNGATWVNVGAASAPPAAPPAIRRSAPRSRSPRPSPRSTTRRPRQISTATSRSGRRAAAP